MKLSNTLSLFCVYAKMCFPASKLCLLSLQMRRQLALFSDNLIFVGSWLLLNSYFSISVILPLFFLCLGNLKE